MIVKEEHKVAFIEPNIPAMNRREICQISYTGKFPNFVNFNVCSNDDSNYDSMILISWVAMRALPDFIANMRLACLKLRTVGNKVAYIYVGLPFDIFLLFVRKVVICPNPWS